MLTNTPSIDSWLDAEESRQREKILAKVTEVCAVPATAQRVLSLSASDDAGIRMLADAVMADAAITAQLLRIANSPIYAHSRQIKDVSRAIVMIGRKELSSIAAAMAMMAAVQSDTPLSAQLNRSSVLSATLARLTAQRVDKSIDPSVAFLSGLLCEIGALACLAVDGDGYMQVHEQAAGSFERLAELEQKRYSTLSEEIGAHMLKRNLLPEEVTEAVGTSLSQDLDEASDLQRITLFCRLSAPVIVAAVKSEDTESIVQRVSALAERFRIDGLESDEILDMCIFAAAAAELRLRGRAVD